MLELRGVSGELACRGGKKVPSGPSFMADVVEPEVMQNHQAPVASFKLSTNVSRDVEIYFGEILDESEP